MVLLSYIYDYYLESYVNLCSADKITWLGVGRWALDGPYTLPGNP